MMASDEDQDPSLSARVGAKMFKQHVSAMRTHCLRWMRAVVRPRWRLLWVTPRSRQAGTTSAQVHCHHVQVCSGARPCKRQQGQRQGGRCSATVTVAEPIVQQNDRQHASIEWMSVQDILHSLRQSCMFDVASGYEVHTASQMLPIPPGALMQLNIPPPQWCALSALAH